MRGHLSRTGVERSGTLDFVRLSIYIRNAFVSNRSNPRCQELLITPAKFF